MAARCDTDGHFVCQDLIDQRRGRNLTLILHVDIDTARISAPETAAVLKNERTVDRSPIFPHSNFTFAQIWEKNQTRTNLRVIAKRQIDV